MTDRPLVIIESPFRGDRALHERYARACLFDSIRRGEAPLASHLLYPQVLNEEIAEERSLGVALGLAWLAAADLQAFYLDFGFSFGMAEAAQHGLDLDVPREWRNLSKEVLDAL